MTDNHEALLVVMRVVLICNLGWTRTSGVREKGIHPKQNK